MPRLLALTPGELSRDPRGRRSALAASAHGYDVYGICPHTTDAPLALDGVKVVRVSGERLAPRLNRMGLGGMAKKERSVVRELRGIYRLLRLARLTLLTVRAARELGAVDVVHAHEIDMLPAAFLLRGRPRIVYDAHEIYASSEPDPPRAHRAVIRLLEGVLARRAAAVATVSDAIADELQMQLRLPRRPHVTMNCPNLVEGVVVAAPAERLQAIYQGAMGPGRPLDDLFAAAEASPAVDLSIRVANANLDELRAAVGRLQLADHVVVREPVAPTELVQSLAGFDIGLVFNRPVTRNDELVFPNKLFEYMMAGLALVVPALPSLGVFVEEHGIGVTFPPGDPRGMGEALQQLAAQPDAVLAYRRRARELAVERFNAEAQEQSLVALWDPAA